MNDLKHLKTFENFTYDENDIIEEGLWNGIPSEKKFKAKMAQYTAEKGEPADPYQIAATFKFGLKNQLVGGNLHKHYFAVNNNAGDWVSPIKLVSYGGGGKDASSNNAEKAVTNDTLKAEYLKDGIDLDNIA